MKAAFQESTLLPLIAVLIPTLGYTQGTFVYDQQSSDETYLGGASVGIRAGQPFGQSFTPVLSSVGFIRLYLSDDAFNSLGATVFVNLRTNSITGPILASSAPVVVPDHFIGPADFLFSTPVQVTPEVTYYFQPVIQSGDNFSVYAYNTFNYSRGMEFYQGAANPGFDLWFREGIVIPEPGTSAVLGLGLGLLAWRRRLFLWKRMGSPIKPGQPQFS